MKKFIALIMALVMTLSFAACGGESASAPNPSSSAGTEATVPTDTSEAKPDNNEAATEVEYVTKTFGHIIMSVPSLFGDVTEQDGMYASAGPESSIVVTPALDIDLLPSEWDETLAAQSLELYYSETYTDMELAAFDGDVNMNGNQAVYFAFFGTNASGKERTVQVVRLYNADLTALYVITFIHSADSDFFTADIASQLINSITLAPEAQNLGVSQ